MRQPTEGASDGIPKVGPLVGPMLFRKRGRWGQTSLLDVEGKIFGADPVVGSIGLHLRDGAVEPVAESFIALAQTDAVRLMPVGWFLGGIAEDVAARAFAGFQKLG